MILYHPGEKCEIDAKTHATREHPVQRAQNAPESIFSRPRSYYTATRKKTILARETQDKVPDLHHNRTAAKGSFCGVPNKKSPNRKNYLRRGHERRSTK